MHGMLRGYDAEGGDRYQREAGEADPTLSRAEAEHLAQQQLLQSPVQLCDGFCDVTLSLFTVFHGKPTVA